VSDPEDRLDSEIETHLDLLARDYESRGLPPDEARAAARRAFGNIPAMKDRHRDVRGVTVLNDLARDVRDTVRTLARTPAFTIPVVLSLAFAMAANVAAFSVLNTLALRPLPVTEPERLFLIRYFTDAGVTDGGNYAWFEQVRDRARGLSAAFVAHRRGNVKVAVDNDVEALSGLQVTGTYFSGLGVAPQIGRLISAADEAADAAVVVLSDTYWSRRFGRDPGVVGRTIRIDNRPHEVIGVTRAGFFGPEIGRRVDVTVPIDRSEYRQGWVSMAVVVRLAPDVSADAAAAELTGRLHDFARTLPPPVRDRFLARRVELAPMAHGLSTNGSTRDRFTRPAVIAASLIALMLLVATVNWAMLLMARASARRREAAVRCALGATTFRLVRQLIVENLCLAATAASLGLAVAMWAVGVLPGNGLPADLQIESDGRVLLFASVLALLMGLLFSVGPISMTRRVGGDDLRTASMPLDRRGARGAQLLVVAQVAISVVVIAAAGFFGATVLSLQGQETGFSADGVITFSLDADGTGLDGPPLTALHRRVLERLRAIDGVQSATLARVSPLSGTEDGKRLTIPGFTPRDPDDLNVNVNEIGPAFFETFGIPVLRGRPVTADDHQGRPQVAWISQNAADYYYAGRDPIGSRIEIRGAVTFPAEIVGVVADVMYDSLRADADRMFYVPFFQRGAAGEYVLAVRTTAGREAFVMRDIPRAVQGVVPDVPVLQMGTLARWVDARAGNERLLAAMSAVLAALALVLVAIGVYGIVAYTVVRRTTEFGLRIALGATPGDLMRRVTSGTVRVVAVGIAIGLAVAVFASVLVADVLYGVQPGDPRVYAAAVVILVMTAIGAAVPPVIRAVRLEPMAALRSE
jgi:predicted permease